MAPADRASVECPPEAEIRAIKALSPRLRQACIDTIAKVAATPHPTAADLGSLLAAMPCYQEDIVAHAVYQDSEYCRTSIASSESADLVLIGWKPGQHSPAHDHGGSESNRCAVRVISGTGIERRFKLTDNDQIIETGSSRITPGDIVLNDGPDIHELGCEPGANEPLVTLHLYSPPLTKEDMTVFAC